MTAKKLIAISVWSYVAASTGVSAWAGMFDNISITRVATGLSQPLYVTAPPDDPNRLFVVEKGSAAGDADIRILDLTTGQMRQTPFLSLSGLQTGQESGLMGMAFHPDFANNGKFYLNMTTGFTRINVIEYQVNPNNANLADPDTARTVLHLFKNNTGIHNGGWIGFNPKIEPDDPQYLYVNIGDGGGRTSIEAQDTTDSFLGKILRLDVDGPDALPNNDNRNYAFPDDNPFVGKAGRNEIWAYGLRNPWRSGFDRQTGDLYIGDVGANTREEIDFLPADDPGGANFGWRLREGTVATPGGFGGDRPEGNVDPIFDYGHVGGQGAAVIGGYVYRGPVKELQGQYFFADSSRNQVWSFVFDEASGQVSDLIDWTDQLDAGPFSLTAPVSFGEDAVGHLYVVDITGSVFRIVPEPSSGLLLLALVGVARVIRRR